MTDPDKWEIYKFQRPITTSDPNLMDSVLVYDESREREYQVELHKGLDDLFKEGEFKFYARALIIRRGSGMIIEVGERVEDQDW